MSKTYYPNSRVVRRPDAYKLAEANGYAYFGDVNLEHGGTFAKLDNVKYGYADVVEVTDLDGGCGADGMCLIEKGSVSLSFRRVRAAVKCCGWFDREDRHRMGRDKLRAAFVEAVQSYYGADVDESEIIQTDPTFPMTQDGWTARKVVSHTDLAGYVAAVWLE